MITICFGRTEGEEAGDPVRRSDVLVAFRFRIKRRGRRFYEFNGGIHFDHHLRGQVGAGPLAGAAYEAGGGFFGEGAADGLNGHCRCAVADGMAAYICKGVDDRCTVCGNDAFCAYVKREGLTVGAELDAVSLAND